MSAYKKPDWLPDWISITSDGRISWYEGLKKGGGKRRQKRCGSVTVAERQARELLKLAKRSSGLAIAIDATWADLCQEWVDAHDGKIKEGTFRSRLSTINTWILPTVGDVKLASTDLSTLVAVADQAVAANLAVSTFDGITQTVTNIARWGRARRLLPEQPFGPPDDRIGEINRLRKIVAANYKPNKEKDLEDTDEGITIDRVPTWDDVLELSAAVAARAERLSRSSEIGERCGRAIKVAAGTGLRMCELLAITEADVNMKKGFISVTKQYDRYTAWKSGKPMPVVLPKYDRPRKVMVWAKIKEDLEALIEAADGGPLVPRTQNQAWWPDAWGKVLQVAIEDIEWQWKGHWLRHHYGSFSLAPREYGGFGLTPAEVQTSLGHKDLTTTLKTYIQPIRDAVGWVE